MKLIASNKKAKRDYEIFETYQAGIELKGVEIKSLRVRGCSLDESFARVEHGEVFLYNMHIPEFMQAYFKVDPRRTRKLLLNKKEIKKLIGSTTQKGCTLVPLKIYINERGFAKIDIALARGRKLYDKRKKIKDEIARKESDRALKRARKYH